MTPFLLLITWDVMFIIVFEHNPVVSGCFLLWYQVRVSVSSAHTHASPGGNMVGYVTKKRETKHERGGLCMDEDSCGTQVRSGCS